MRTDKLTSKFQMALQEAQSLALGLLSPVIFRMTRHYLRNE